MRSETPDILKYGVTEEVHEKARGRCEKCGYRNQGWGEMCCNYIGITGKARITVSPGVGDECTEFLPMIGSTKRKTGQLGLMKTAKERPRDQEENRLRKIAKQVRSMYEEGMSDRKIAAELRISTAAVKRWRMREGLGVNNQGGISNKELERRRKLTKEMWEQGRTYDEIAKEVGVNKRTVAKWRKEMGLESRH